MFNIRYLLLFPIFFMFFPHWAIFYTSTSYMSFSFLFRIIFVPTLLFFEKKRLVKLFIHIYKKTPFKYLFAFLVWIIISGICSVLLKNYSIGNFFYKIIFGFIISCMFTYVFTFLLFPKYFSIKTLWKIVIIGNFVIFIIGIIEGIAKAFDINIIINFVDFMINQRTWLYEGSIPYLDRVHSTLAEPGWLGSFICFNIPILYSLMNSPYKLFKNKIVNFVFKKITPYLAIINMFLTKSPIWLIIFLLITGIYYFQDTQKFIKKHFTLVFAITLLSVITVFSLVLLIANSVISIQGTYLYRIIIFLYNCFDLEQLVLAEPSMANRIISYIITMSVFIEHPIIGIGYQNTENVIMPIIETNQIPYTNEIKVNYARSIINNTQSVHINGAIFYNTLADTGIIGFLLLYLFFIKSYIFIGKLMKYMNGMEKDFAKGISFSILTIIITSIYDTHLSVVYLWFLFGTVISLYLSIRFRSMIYKSPKISATF